MQLIDQLLINRNKRDEHKQHLKELEKEWDEYHSPSAAAAAAPNNASDDDDVVVATPIATYDNAAAAAAVKITVEHREHAMQLNPQIYLCHLPHGSDINAVKKTLLIQAFAARN